MEPIRHENYPLWVVVVSNIVSLTIYATGIIIISRIGIIWTLLYVAYCLCLELKALRHCTDCYYYGKTCAFARGRISCLFFKKGKSEEFARKPMTLKDFITDLLVSLIPAVIAIVLLITNFNWLILLLLVVLILLTTAGNGFVRGSLACKYCKQLDLGCPAAQLLLKKREGKEC